MSEKVIIVKRKKKKDKRKIKPKAKPKATMEQKQTQNVRVIINERARPRRNRGLAVKGYNAPRLSIQPPTIIHKGIDQENALNNFRNINDIRIRALERGLNGINGNITNLTSQLQNNRPPPLNTPVPSSNTPVASEMDDEERQGILDGRMAERLQQEQEAQKRQIEKDFYNNPFGVQGEIFNNFINRDIDDRAAEDLYSQSNPNLPEAESRFLVPEAEAEEVVKEAESEKITPQRQKFTREEREQRSKIKTEIIGEKSIEFTEERIRNADGEELEGMIMALGRNEGFNFFDPISGGIKKGQIGNLRNFIRNAVRENKKKRQVKEQSLKGGKTFESNLNRNL
tara:strand:+ start:2351 stop:3373 length:1023 start_codon:yes stop_codon:yes gene_type:complete